MSTPILATKLYVPRPRPKTVLRPRLLEQLTGDPSAAGTPHVTLVSAATGFGKTTLVSEWVADLQTSPRPRQVSPRPPGEGPGVRVAWLSLDEGDSDPTRFLAYLIAALQTVAPHVGQGALVALSAPQPPPPEAILTAGAPRGGLGQPGAGA